MESKNPAIRWGVEQRLEFIEFRLFWEGGVNRADIINIFGVSVPQASKDLALYQERAPGNAEYDKSAKRYVPSTNFEPRFMTPDPSGYLSRLRSLSEGLANFAECWIRQPPETDAAITPHREIELCVLRAVLSAIRERKSLKICYQSMNKKRPDPTWRRITPHAFGYDGFRWHVRAYCHLENKFKDFLLPRTLDVGEMGVPGEPGECDWLWNNFFEVVVGPHPDLADSQKKVVAKDYGFEDGKGVFKIRYAMLFYTLKKLGLLGEAKKLSPRTQHIVTINHKETELALERAEFQL